MPSWRTLTLLLALTLLSCGGGQSAEEEDEDADPPEVVLGERLFLETRFAQAFFAAAGGQVNADVPGDPVLDTSITVGAPLPGPFRGQTMNCRACHLVDEQRDTPNGGVRTYSDFARRSPVPARADGEQMTARNSPPLVNASLLRDTAFFLHFDGEFASTADLVRGTFSGRNFGWLAAEGDVAVAHIANVVRGDDGRGQLAAAFGALPYRVVLSGTDPGIPAELRLPPQFRIDVDQATDAAVLDAVANVVSAYVESLLFAQDAAADFFASPYDTFLRKNGLSRSPQPGESSADYSRRLAQMVEALTAPRFVTPANGTFRLHAQEFAFGEEELAGLRVFLRSADTPSPAGSVGNCVSCHPAPAFTDFGFHNTGAAQEEYDSIHGSGTFAALEVPGLTQRNAAADEFLPPSSAHPHAQEVFRAVPSADHPELTDLGLWNVFANPAMPAPQASLQALLCSTQGVGSDCTAEALLPVAIARFKTPGLRSLGQSAPYLHTGQKDTLEDVLQFYVTFSALTRAGRVRNPAPELADIQLSASDVDPLAAFLRSLNEDYE